MTTVPLPEYQIKRSRRKTLALTFDRQGQLVVRSPQRVPKKTIETFVADNRQWITAHQQEILKELAIKEAFDFSDGLSLPLLGQPRSIATGTLGYTRENIFLPAGTPAQRQAAFFSLLRTVGQNTVPPIVQRYAEALDVMPQRITITSARTRWGSCSTKGNLCFSRLLFCLSPQLIDYVVAHEVAHLKEHNHSTRFYRTVESLLPNHRALQNELRDVQLPF